MLLIALITQCLTAQTIQGHFPKFPNSTFELKGFEGFTQTSLSTTKSDETGAFSLSFPKTYIGLAQLYMNGTYQQVLFLNQENITLHWEDLTKRDDLKTNSKEYEAFLGGMKTFQDMEAKIAGLHYLVPLYAKDSLKQQWYAREIDTVANAFPHYIKALPETMFVRQYLLAKGLIEQMPKSVSTYTWRAPAHIYEFMAIDFKTLKHSGLYKEVIEGYTNLAEHFSQEEANQILKAAIDKVVTELKDEPTLQQEIAQHWFTYLESKSMFPSSEHLALTMLNQSNCQLSDKSTNLFEQYRKLAVSKTAPNIVLNLKNKNNQNDLKSLKNSYKLVIFGASWCPNCQTDFPKLKEKYKTLKATYDVELVYISIDTDKKAFEEHYKEAPFITFCDAKGWETQAAKDYHVFATPTYILLDKNLKIAAKINSPEHLEAWLQANAKK